MSSPVTDHFNRIAPNYDYYKKKNRFYYQNLKKLLRRLIPKNKNILEIGCGTGDLLAYLSPKIGYGIDISDEMIKISKRKYNNNSNLHFSTDSINKFKAKRIDYIFMCDVVEHLPKPGTVFKEISKIMTKDTIFINTMANPLWEPILMLAEKLNLKMPEGEHHRWSTLQLQGHFKKTGLTIVNHDYDLLLPLSTPFSDIINHYLMPLLKCYASIEYFVVKKK